MDSSEDLKSEKGQLSIFLGIALFVVMAMMAFVVNVGLFVKAKINLQNATDAAAWAGASVQARQLSNIAYVNYYFRQIFKEWMFKYYILGNVGGLASANSGGTLAAPDPNGDTTNFRSYSIDIGANAGGNAAPPGRDKFNVPSICLHVEGNDCTGGGCPNICAIASIPGLPDFPTMHTSGIHKANKGFITQMARMKARDCSDRTDFNFTAGITWAYGSGEGRNNVRLPSILGAHRMGAWSKALLTAVRMRNLEAIVNRPPLEAICGPNADSCPAGGQKIEELSIEETWMPYNERPVKAFWAAYRNLSGGNKKERGMDPFAKNLVLEELAPKVQEVRRQDLGGYLIPPNNSHQVGGDLLKKYYLDLKIMPVNYATFYSFFKSARATTGIGHTSDADCDQMKVAIPVPSYVTGFVKNNHVMTYYAVKATSRFVGLFFPFFRFLPDGIELQAYAAAKPFGGRIGPWFFKASDQFSVVPRGDLKSTPHLVSLRGTNPDVFEAGDPVPGHPDFYYAGSGIIGGVPSNRGQSLTYAIPNMIYDFNGGVNDLIITGIGDEYLPLTRALAPSGNPPRPKAEEKPIGLYNWNQYEMFKLATVGDRIPRRLGNDKIRQGIVNSQKPTRYEALNWMIPLRPGDDDNMEAPATAVKANDDPNFSLFYAPLFGEGTLYEEATDVINQIGEYLENNRDSLNVFLMALKDVAQKILDIDPDMYKDSAGRIFPVKPGETVLKNADMGNGDFTCDQGEDRDELSLAGRFYHLLKPSDIAECDVTPIMASLKRVIESMENTDEKDYLITEYVEPDGGWFNAKNLSTAYAPGGAHGSGPDVPTESDFFTPLQATASLSSRRNYYSTKFIHVEKLLFGSNAPDGIDYRESLLVEERSTSTLNVATDIVLGSGGIVNTLSEEAIGSLREWGEIRH